MSLCSSKTANQFAVEPYLWCAARGTRSAETILQILKAFLALTLLLLTIGCQQLPIGQLKQQQVSVTAKETTVEDPNSEDSDRKTIAEGSDPLLGRWNFERAWPEPAQGPAAMLKLAQTPRFRWHFERPEIPPVKNLADQYGNTVKPEADRPALFTRIGNPSMQELAEWWNLSDHDDAQGLNACILLAYHAPEKLDASRINRLVRIVQQEIDLNPQVINTTPVQSSKTKSLWGRLRPSTQEDPQAETVPEVIEENANSAKEEQVDDEITIQQRAAAAEAWCFVISRQQTDVEMKYREPGLMLKNADLPQLIRQELMIGIAREIPPRKIPGLAELLSPKTKPALQELKQLAVLEACLLYAVNHQAQFESSNDDPDQPATMELTQADPDQLWPVSLWEHRWDESPEMAIRFGQWLALIRHPLAETYLTQKLNHVDPGVKLASLCSLGLLPGQSVNTLLSKRLEQEQGQNKAIVLSALSYHHPEIIDRYVDDADRQVRLQVVNYSGDHPSRSSATTLLKLVKDRDSEIQYAAIDVVAEWQPEFAFPILSSGFQTGLYKTRQRAREILEQQYQIVISGIEDTPEQRRQILAQIQSEHNTGSSWSETPIFHADADRNQPEEDLIAQQTRVRTQLNQLLNTEVSATEKKESSQELQKTAERTPLVLNRELNRLPLKELKLLAVTLSKVPCRGCEPFEDLESDQVLQRRKAAHEFAEISSQETLPEWTLRLLGEHLKQEQDPHVCRAIVSSISNDTTPQTRHIAEIALLHPWADVRILGCQYAGKHRMPQLAPLLIPMLQERNQAVQIAAIKAAGLCRNPIVINGLSSSDSNSLPSGLRMLLGTVPGHIELEVLLALARLDDAQGKSELIKLAYSPDAERRREVVMKISELDDREFIEPLIRLGWTETDPQVQRVILQDLNQLIPSAEQPDFSKAENYDDRIKVWSTWLEQSKLQN